MRGVVLFSRCKAQDMMKRLFFGIMWLIAIYIAACIITGAVFIVIAGINDPANALETIHEAGIRIVSSVRVYIIAGTVALLLAATWADILPGVRANKSEKKESP